VKSLHRLLLHRLRTILILICSRVLHTFSPQIRHKLNALSSFPETLELNCNFKRICVQIVDFVVENSIALRIRRNNENHTRWIPEIALIFALIGYSTIKKFINVVSEKSKIHRIRLFELSITITDDKPL
jgi:hypothetical protein